MSRDQHKGEDSGEDSTPRQKPGGQTEGRRDRPSRTQDAHEVSETELAPDKMGNNQLQGEDQEKVHNERHAQAGVTKETDSVMEGLKRRDK